MNFVMPPLKAEWLAYLILNGVIIVILICVIVILHKELQKDNK